MQLAPPQWDIAAVITVIAAFVGLLEALRRWRKRKKAGGGCGGCIVIEWSEKGLRVFFERH